MWFVVDTQNISIDNAIEDKEKLLSMLIDRKLKLNNSSDEGKVSHT